MAETSQIIFSHKEVAEALIKQQGIHEGIWGLWVKFGIQGANIGLGPSGLMPAAIVPVLEIGLQKFDEVNNLSVDAAEVNPAPGIKEGGEFDQGEFYEKNKKSDRV